MQPLFKIICYRTNAKYILEETQRFGSQIDMEISKPLRSPLDIINCWTAQNKKA